MSNTEIYEKVTAKVIESLENGVVPWHQPWIGGTASYPRSMSNGKLYRGMNVWLLQISQQAMGYASPWWGTYKNITENGGQVRKGEHATMVILWKPFTKPDPDDPSKQKKHFMLRYFNVFNAEQADWANGLPKKWTTPTTNGEISTFQPAEDVVTEYLMNGGPGLQENHDGACYLPALDKVLVPERGSFISTERYYSTLFHELGHSTGAAKRLNREGVTNFDSFGTHQYAAEELIAEMTAAMLCGVTGVSLDVDHSASYIAHWLGVLRNDHKLLVGAAGKAQKAADCILGVSWAAEDTDNEKELVTA